MPLGWWYVRGRFLKKNLWWSSDRSAYTLLRTLPFLESNTILASAIHTYRKLGFQELQDRPADYNRVNIQIVLTL